MWNISNIFGSVITNVERYTSEIKSSIDVAKALFNRK
jgi:hypothetical protein